MTEAEIIGSQLKSRRKKLSYSIQQLSQLSGVSTGQISQIEQGKVIPTVVCLHKIAQAIEVDLNYFFQNESKYSLQHNNERRLIITNEDRNYYEILSPNDSKNHKIDFMKITMKAGSSYEEGEDNNITHEGEECGYVISGSMIVCLENERIVMHEGDSIYFDSTRPHHYENPFDTDCESIWAMTPLFF